MEIATEPTIPQTPNQSESADSEQPEIFGGGGTAATPELETPKIGTPDLENNTLLENTKSECKTPTPNEKTGEKQRILVHKNGSMDRLKVPPKSPNVGKKVNLECKTPTPVKQTGQRVKIGGGIEFPKNGTPNRLKVPIAFKYPERYKSPTDLMLSPISKGLLARSRKGAVPSKMHELRSPEMSLLYQS